MSDAFVATVMVFIMVGHTARKTERQNILLQCNI